MTGRSDRAAGPTPPAGSSQAAGDDVGSFIRAQRELARMSVRRLADLAGVSNPYLSQIERGIRRPSAEILQQLADALRISAETLYVRAGFLRADETGPADSVPAAIERDQHLTPEQKVALVQVYRSFTGERAAEDPVGTDAERAPDAAPD